MPGYNFGKEISGGKETYKDFPSNKQRTGKSSSWESGVLHFWILVWRSALSGRPGTSTLEGGAREGERGLLCLNPVAPGCTINESGCLGMQPQLGAQPSVRFWRLLGVFCARGCASTFTIHNYTNPPFNFTITHLVGTQWLFFAVTNVAEEETYTITAKMNPAVAKLVNPPTMTLWSGLSRTHFQLHSQLDQWQKHIVPARLYWRLE